MPTSRGWAAAGVSGALLLLWAGFGEIELLATALFLLLAVVGGVAFVRARRPPPRGHPAHLPGPGPRGRPGDRRGEPARRRQGRATSSSRTRSTGWAWPASPPPPPRPASAWWRATRSSAGRAGIYPVGPAEVAVTDPFGLTERRAALGEHRPPHRVPGGRAAHRLPGGPGPGPGGAVHPPHLRPAGRRGLLHAARVPDRRRPAQGPLAVVGQARRADDQTARGALAGAGPGPARPARRALPLPRGLRARRARGGIGGHPPLPGRVQPGAVDRRAGSRPPLRLPLHPGHGRARLRAAAPPLRPAPDRDPPPPPGGGGRGPGRGDRPARRRRHRPPTGCWPRTSPAPSSCPPPNVPPSPCSPSSGPGPSPSAAAPGSLPGARRGAPPWSCRGLPLLLASRTGRGPLRAAAPRAPAALVRRRSSLGGGAPGRRHPRGGADLGRRWPTGCRRWPWSRCNLAAMLLTVVRIAVPGTTWFIFPTPSSFPALGTELLLRPRRLPHRGGPGAPPGRDHRHAGGALLGPRFPAGLGAAPRAPLPGRARPAGGLPAVRHHGSPAQRRLDRGLRPPARPGPAGGGRRPAAPRHRPAHRRASAGWRWAAPGRRWSTGAVALLAALTLASTTALAGTLPRSGLLDWRVPSALTGGFYGSISYNPFVGIRQQLVNPSRHPAPDRRGLRRPSLGPGVLPPAHPGVLRRGAVVRRPPAGGPPGGSRRLRGRRHRLPRPHRPGHPERDHPRPAAGLAPGRLLPHRLRRRQPGGGRRLPHQGGRRRPALRRPHLPRHDLHRGVARSPSPISPSWPSTPPGSPRRSSPRPRRANWATRPSPALRPRSTNCPTGSTTSTCPPAWTPASPSLARSRVRGLATDFERALALEAYFRDSGAFRYSTEVDRRARGHRPGRLAPRPGQPQLPHRLLRAVRHRHGGDGPPRRPAQPGRAGLHPGLAAHRRAGGGQRPQRPRLGGDLDALPGLGPLRPHPAGRRGQPGHLGRPPLRRHRVPGHRGHLVDLRPRHQPADLPSRRRARARPSPPPGRRRARAGRCPPSRSGWSILAGRPGGWPSA